MIVCDVVCVVGCVVVVGCDVPFVVVCCVVVVVCVATIATSACVTTATAWGVRSSWGVRGRWHGKVWNWGHGFRVADFYFAFIIFSDIPIINAISTDIIVIFIVSIANMYTTLSRPVINDFYFTIVFTARRTARLSCFFVTFFI